jgi:branched-chain amino acid transport system substrate-binding protein
LVGIGPTPATETIKIGCIDPLTGNAAKAGQSAKAAVELAAEIVNGPDPKLKEAAPIVIGYKQIRR